MSSRKLKLNPDKTDFLVNRSKVQREYFSKGFPTRLVAKKVTPSPSARNLGVVFHSALHFKSRISGISRACYYHTRDMRRIRRFSTPYVAKAIATPLIGSKLDYCNSVLFNVTEKEISKLQGVHSCSSDLNKLNVPRVSTAVGSRAFSIAAPRLWNELPSEIHWMKTQISFRKKLKMYFLVRLFRLQSSVFELGSPRI